MNRPDKRYPTLNEYARAMEQEANFAELRAETLALSALKVEREGDWYRAKSMWGTCRKIRVQAILDRSSAEAARVAAGQSPPSS